MISVGLSLIYMICAISHCCKFCHIELYLYIGLIGPITLYIQRRLYLLNYSIFTMTNLPPPLNFPNFWLWNWSQGSKISAYYINMRDGIYSRKSTAKDCKVEFKHLIIWLIILCTTRTKYKEKRKSRNFFSLFPNRSSYSSAILRPAS